jgi:hypothetical protein
MSEFYAVLCGILFGGFIGYSINYLIHQPESKLERNTEYRINDQELFLFATNGFWDREERMEVYRRIKARKIEKQVSV